MYEVYAPRVNLCNDFRDAGILQGKIHSVFNSVINLLFVINGERRIITLIREKIPLLPDSVVIPDTIFSILKEQHKCGIIKYRNAIYIGQFLLLLHSPPDTPLFLPDMVSSGFQKDWSANILKLISFSYPTDMHTDLERLPACYRRAAASFAEGYVSKERKKIEEAFHELIGAGGGLTPSCDDAVLGIMAGASTWLTVKEGDTGKDKFRELSQGILQDLKQGIYTTDISCKYLKCACGGRFSILLCNLLKWIFFAGREEHLPEELILSVCDIGHTSGMDMLFGLNVFWKEVIRCID